MCRGVSRSLFALSLVFGTYQAALAQQEAATEAPTCHAAEAADQTSGKPANERPHLGRQRLTTMEKQIKAAGPLAALSACADVCDPSTSCSKPCNENGTQTTCGSAGYTCGQSGDRKSVV